MAELFIRRARDGDAETVSAVLIRSITQLCAADHRNDPKIIAAWTRNKTPINIQKWVENEGTPIFVAVGEGGDIAGVGAVETSGRILLNYVDPAFRRHGVSKALLMWMENFLLECGVATATLTATETALVFYQRAGWERSGPREEDFGFPGYPMRKHLNANDSRG